LHLGAPRIANSSAESDAGQLVNAFVALGVNLEFLIEDEWREWMVLGYDRAAPPAPDEFWRRRYPGKDNAGYRVSAMWLTDAELAEYLRDFAAITQPRLANAPQDGRQRRMLYTVLLPAPDTHRDEPDKPTPQRRRARKTKKENT
jgi:hypothetical protein